MIKQTDLGLGFAGTAALTSFKLVNSFYSYPHFPVSCSEPTILCRHAWHLTCLLSSQLKKKFELQARSHTHVIMYSAAVPYTYPACHRALPCSYG